MKFIIFFALAGLLSVIGQSHSPTESLNGYDWKVYSTSEASQAVQFKGTVPGCIHTDWHNHIGHRKQNNPFYRFNDHTWKGIADSDWVYEKNFTVNQSLLDCKEQWLVFDGVDTLSNVYLNSRALGTTHNMFVCHYFNVTGIVQTGHNLLKVSFQSATRYVNKTSEALSYPIPPECPPDVQHGFCHVNLIRKEQSSFSWDWGPGFATQGIWKPASLIGINKAFLTDVSLTYDWDAEVMKIESRFLVAGSAPTFSCTIGIFITELAIYNATRISVNATDSSVTVHQAIPKKDIQLWWPNGQGEQKLYNVTVHLQTEDLSERSSKTLWFGFRKIELVQSPINNFKGLTFYFKINGQPIFAKGANWVPGDAFPSRITEDNYTSLLRSVKDANMNTLRVWGGGIYESDKFYELADSMGIMIWQDFMFACAMYPSNATFLESVSIEVFDALWKLKSHASIISWSGNNENEAALATNWYNTLDHFERYRKDYIALYVDTIRKLVTEFDSSRPFLTSSPTNGAESQREGWVAKNPYDVHYGDVHYYNYADDCLDWTKYPKARFASEYGYQSFSSIETMSAVSLPSDLVWNSSFIVQRNHHLDGNEQILDQILKHFNTTRTDSDRKYFENLVYLSQIMQGLCYKSQTEFYRRSRSELDQSGGHTMGALYWQLNDVWQTTSWSSLEYGGRWKALHYFAKKFFANVALAAYEDDNNLRVYSLSDSSYPIEPVTLTIEMHSWDSFGPAHMWKSAVYVTPQSSKLLFEESISLLLTNGSCHQKEACYFVIYFQELSDVAPTYFYPTSFKNIVGLKKGTVQVKNVILCKSSSSDVVRQEYMILLSSSTPAFFVMLQTLGIKGRFSDNAFHIIKKDINVTFYAWEITSADSVKSSISIKSLADTSLGAHYSGNQEAKLNKHNLVPNHFPSTRKNSRIWLDDVETQLTFGVCGVFFLLFFAVLLVCVIMRFSTPHMEKGLQNRPLSTPQKQSHVRDDSASIAFLLNLQDPNDLNKQGVQVYFHVQ